MKCSKTQRMGVGQRIGPYIKEVRLGEWEQDGMEMVGV